MPIHNRIADFHDEMTEWRRDIHAHPEIGFEEQRTSAIVAEKLESWGIEVHRGIAETGVIGVLRGNGSGTGTIGIRADMDALPMQEEGEVPYRSQIDNRMHGCGHDGHTTMLLGAARYLAETRNFDGTVHFIFQPAEEGRGGARKMVSEGLFDRFPCDTVWAIHNAPHLPLGTMAFRAGASLASADRATLRVRGKGSHAARPHDSVDPIAVGVQLYQGVQTIVSRNVDPLKPLVMSITQFHAGTANNVIAATAELIISIRAYDADVQDLVEKRLGELCDGVGRMYGATVELEYLRGVAATISGEAESAFAADVAENLIGADKVTRNGERGMGSEDFSMMLAERPGAFLWLGGGEPGKDYGLHHPKYDFNDAALPIGASFWASLVEARLPRG
ncbi:putative hydrolase [alpha proteobacterium BAL199]|jgi:amidohydrolase|nr:putative hydrolase [alpha proteobacterium BAL199]